MSATTTATTTATLNELAPRTALATQKSAAAALPACTGTAALIRMHTTPATRSTHAMPPTGARRADNLVWFELPVTELPVAKAFYEYVFDTEMRIDPRFPELAIFARRREGAITGALIQEHEDHGSHLSKPSDQGAIVYLNCDGDLDGVLARAKAAGGTVLQEVAQLPGEMGWIAQIRDLDGNRVGLHATF